MSLGARCPRLNQQNTTASRGRGDDFTLDRFFGRVVRNDVGAGGRALLFHALYDDSIMQRTNLHTANSFLLVFVLGWL